VLSIADARKRAGPALQRIRDGLPAFETPPSSGTFQDIAEQWLKRHVHAKGLRSADEIARLLKVYVYPVWRRRQFISIRRSDVAALLDQIEDQSGARQADYVLAVIRGVMNWFATREDDYRPPIVKGMRRQDPKAGKRERILNDDELRQIWHQAAANGTFGALVRLLLLTGQRREKVVSMRWEDLAGNSWTIPSETREKGNADVLLLPQIAVDIIIAQPRFAGNPYVLAGRGVDGPVNGFSKLKAAFDAELPNVAHWVLHDLRRTARSLMSRAGVRPDLAERVMGHAIAGVEGIYDRFSYRDEKADALARLANLVDSILNPRPNNVLPLLENRDKSA
jgi:integrase